MATAGILTIRAANTPEQHVQAVYKAEQDINSTKNTNNSASTVKGENGFAIVTSGLASSGNDVYENYMALAFDSVDDVNVRRSADVTSYPVENGATVSDHVQVKNNKFSLKGRITETPIKSDPGLLKSAGVNGNRRMAQEKGDPVFWNLISIKKLCYSVSQRMKHLPFCSLFP